MDSSSSEQDLDLAIQELDGMYNDLRESYRRHSQGEKHILGAPESPRLDDEDYDIPRPAEGLFNTTPKIRATYRSFHHASPSSAKELLAVPAEALSQKSPTTSFKSEYSSGLGTLPKQLELGGPMDINFPGPPDFEAPTPTSPVHHDSDYDDVASISSESSAPDKIVYSRLYEENRKSLDSSPDYAVIRKDHPPHDVTMSRNQDGSNYPVVFGVPNSQSVNVVSQEAVQDPEVPERDPMVVQIERINGSSVKVMNEAYHQRGQNYSFMPPQAESAQSVIEEKPEGVANHVIDSPFPVEVNINVEEMLQQNRRLSSPTSQASPLHLYGRGSGTYPTLMDTEGQRKGKKSRGPECPCECRAVVPLMTVAIVIGIAVLMLVIIGCIYVGIKNDQYLYEARNRLPGEVNSNTTAGYATTASLNGS